MVLFSVRALIGKLKCLKNTYPIPILNICLATFWIRTKYQRDNIFLRTKFLVKKRQLWLYAMCTQYNAIGYLT